MQTETTLIQLSKGTQLLEDGYLEEAIASFHIVIELDPNHSWAYNYLGEALAKQGKLKEAVTAYRKVIELKPDFSWSYHHLGDVLEQQQQWEESVLAFRQAIQLNPEHFGSYVGLGKSLVKLGRLDEAIATYRRASELEPETDWIQYKLGEVLQQRAQLDLEEAIASYRQAIELNPDDVQAYRKLLMIQPNNFESYLELGNTLVKQNQWEEAIASYRRACQLNPESFESYYQLGETLCRQTQLKLESLRSNPDAEKVLLQEIQKDDSTITLSQLNDAAFSKATDRLNDADFVKEVYRTYLKREPQANEIEAYSQTLRDSSYTREMLVSIFRESLEFKHQLHKSRYREEEIACHWRTLEISHQYVSEELACYRRAIELNPSCYQSHYKLGKALTKQGKSSEAIAAYQKAVQIGMLLAQENRLEEALSCYQKALETIPEQFTIYSDLGILLVRLGQFEPLLACYHQACKLSPNSPRAYHNLGLLLAQHHFIDEAVTCFQQAPQIQRSTEWDICENIWQELHQLNAIHEANSFDEIDIKLEVAEEYFTLSSKYKILTLQSLTEADNKYLEQVGLSLPNLELIEQHNWDLEEIYINSFGDSPKEHLATKINLSLPYQQVLVETGYIYSVCPFSGKVLRSNQSFVINHLEVGHHDLQGFIYRFVGSEIFYLMNGCPMGEKLLIYVPRLELIINLNAALVVFVQPEKSINKLKSYMVTCWKQVKSYIATEEKKVVDVVGLGFNIGHYLWQDVTGIDVIYKNGLSQNMDIIVGDGEYFSIGEIFPEIPPHNQIHVKDVWAAFKTVLDKNYVAFRANGLFIEEKLINRLCEASFKKCEQNFLNEVEIAKQHFPLLAVQIRTSSRVWLGQAEGIANIIKSLYLDFPNLGVVFDGWSLTGNDDSVSTSWPIIESEKAIMKEILALIPPSIDTYSAIGATTYETVVWWDQAIDLHISPLGAGLVYSLWISRKVGVVHASTLLLNSYRESCTSSGFRENQLPQVLIPNDCVVDAPHGDYNCDWKVIYHEVIQLIEKLSQDRQ
jgi:tetratricopeptide (TPR) repeat protein